MNGGAVAGHVIPDSMSPAGSTNRCGKTTSTNAEVVAVSPKTVIENRTQ